MANIKFTNFATTTLVGTYGTGDTALTVSNVSLFPVVSGGTTWFYAVLTDSLTAPTKREIVKVTSISGSVLTVTRAQDGTSAQTWANGSYIELRLVNKAITDIISETVTDSRTSTTDYTTIADSDSNGSGSHIRKIGSTTYETLTSTVDTFEVPVSQPREISVAEYGAVGNYVPSTGVGTDDSTAIQNALNAAFTAGGGVVTLENKIYKLGAGITIPVGVTLKGPSQNPFGGYVGIGGSWVSGGVDPEVGGSGWASTGRKFRNMAGSLWVCFDAGVGDGTATYNLQHSHGSGSALPNYTTRTGAITVRGRLDSVNVFQYSFDNNLDATYTDSGTWNSAWDSGYMSGLAIRMEADDAAVTNSFIGGFQQAILIYNAQRPIVDGVFLDCINGIEGSVILDRGYINRVHAYLFSSYSNSDGSLVRRGDFIYLHDTTDWVEINECFTYGQKWGFYLANVNEVSISNSAADSTSAEVAGYYGVYIGANTQDVHFTNFRAANRQYGFYINNGNTNLTSVTDSTLLEVDYGYYVATGNLRTFGGKITMAGANKIGFYNASTGTVTVIGPLVTGHTAIFSGANFSYISQGGGIYTQGVGPFVRMEDTTDDVGLIAYSDSANDVTLDAFQVSNTVNKRTIYLNKYGGNVGVGAGVFLLTGGQIEFPATDNPSADANTLDDYQETTWTPALAGASTAGTQTYSTQVGIATKIGRQVVATFNMTLTAKDGASAGDLRITGLPFTSGATFSYAVAWARITNIDLNVGGGFYSVVGELPPGQTYINLYEVGDNIGQAALTVADFNATTTLSGTVIYNV